MSISVSITRRSDPVDEDGPAIGEQEWIAAAEEDGFRTPEGEESEWVGNFSRVWADHPDRAIVFDWVDGQIEVGSPDQVTIAKMKTIATRLAANVISETGEIFNDSGESAGFLPGFP